MEFKMLPGVFPEATKRAMDLFFSGPCRVCPFPPGAPLFPDAPWVPTICPKSWQVPQGPLSLQVAQSPLLGDHLKLSVPLAKPECHLGCGACQGLLQSKHLSTSSLYWKFIASSGGKGTHLVRSGSQILLNITITHGACFNCKYLGPTHRNSISDVWGGFFNLHCCQAHNPLGDNC